MPANPHESTGEGVAQISAVRLLSADAGPPRLRPGDRVGGHDRRGRGACEERSFRAGHRGGHRAGPDAVHALAGADHEAAARRPQRQDPAGAHQERPRRTSLFPRARSLRAGAMPPPPADLPSSSATARDVPEYVAASSMAAGLTDGRAACLFRLRSSCRSRSWSLSRRSPRTRAVVRVCSLSSTSSAPRIRSCAWSACRAASLRSRRR